MNDQAREIAQRFIDAMNRHDAAEMVALCAEDVVFWEPSYDEPLRGRDAIRRDLEGFFAMLPDLKATLELVLADDRHILSEWSYQATYQGRPISVRECSISRLGADNCVAEVRMYFDRLSLLRQLGIAPTN